MPAQRFAYLDTPHPIAFAHRGGDETAENGLAAFTDAQALGYRYIETDVRTSRDGVPFVFHDADLSRMTGDASPIGDLAAREIKRLELPDGGAIPTLSDALEAFPDIRFNLDLKDAAAIAPVAATLRRMDAAQRVCVTAFSQWRVVRARRALGPEVCTGLGVWGAVAFILGSFLPLAPARFAPRAAVLQLPLRWRGFAVVTRRLVERAHQAGLDVHVWTLNDVDTINEALDLGVDGVMSDRLELLKQELVKRGAWTGGVARPVTPGRAGG
jgi:glycerophosphoryl diester phosphodiesterase